MGSTDIENGFENLWSNREVNRLLGFNIRSQCFKSLVGNYGDASKPRQMHRLLIVLVKLIDIYHKQKWNYDLELAFNSIKYMDDCGIFGGSEDIVNERIKALTEIGEQVFGIPFKDRKTVHATVHHPEFLGLDIDADLQQNKDVMLQVSANRLAKMEHRRRVICSGKPYLRVALSQWDGCGYSISELRYPMKSMLRYVSQRDTQYGLAGVDYMEEVPYCPLIANSVNAFHAGVTSLGPIPLSDYKFVIRFKDIPDEEYDLILWTDACTYGYGGYDGMSGEWFYGGFSKQDIQRSIHWKEAMVPLAWLRHALESFPERVQGKKVLMYIDNDGVHRGIMNKKYDNMSVDTVLQNIFKLMIEHRIFIFAKYIRSEENVLADPLSRWWIDKFKKRCSKYGFTRTSSPISVSIPSLTYPFTI